MLKSKLLGVVAMLTLFSAASFGRTGEILEESVWNLRPTQIFVGKKEVHTRAQKLQKMSNDERHAYLIRADHVIPVVIGPGGEYYMFDHHHMAAALVESGHHKAYIKIIADWSDMKKDEFWKNMESHNYAFLYDQDGEKIKPSDLPESIDELQNFRLRSLIYFAKEAGALKEDNIPFGDNKRAIELGKSKCVTEDEAEEDMQAAIRKAIVYFRRNQPKSCAGKFQKS
jgi:hypothetical protein